MSNGVSTNERPMGQPSVTDGELDLGAIGHALWRKKWWVLAPALAVALVTFLGVNLIAPRYKSEARVLIDGRESVFLRPEADKIGDRDRSAIDAEAVQSQVQLVLSREVAREVIKKLKLGESPEFDPVLRGIGPLRQVLMTLGIARNPLRMTPEERILESYFDRLKAYPIDKSRVIAIEFQSSDPEVAARVANAVADSYIELLQSMKSDQTRAASKWLAGEIEDLRARVAEAEAKADEFRSKSNLFVGTNNNTLSNQQLADFNAQVSAARSQRAEAESKARYIRDMLKGGGPIETADVVNSELITRLNEQLATLRGQLAEQSSTLLDGHPRIKELRAQIGNLERQIRREAETLVRTLENDAKISAARVDQLNKSFEQLKQQAASTNEQDVQLRALEREAKAQRDLLESYLAKYREASARENLGAVPADARIISRAVISNTPYFPKKLPIVLIATLATLLLAIGFIATGELLAGNVYRPGVVSHHAVLVPEGTPVAAHWAPPVTAPPLVAAEEPEASAQPETPVMPDMSDDPKSIGDVIAGLRAAGDKARRIIVVGLSENMPTGAATLALARALAEHGRVVTVDLSFGGAVKPAVPTEAAGIADLVNRTASFGQIIARDTASRVHTIPAGRVQDDATRDVLTADRLSIAIDALARSYEYVVVDMGAVPELPAERLARFASYAVLVPGDAADDVVVMARDELAAAGITHSSTLPERAVASAGAGAQVAA